MTKEQMTQPNHARIAAEKLVRWPKLDFEAVNKTTEIIQQAITASQAEQSSQLQAARDSLDVIREQVIERNKQHEEELASLKAAAKEQDARLWGLVEKWSRYANIAGHDTERGKKSSECATELKALLPPKDNTPFKVKLLQLWQFDRLAGERWQGLWETLDLHDKGTDKECFTLRRAFITKPEGQSFDDRLERIPTWLLLKYCTCLKIETKHQPDDSAEPPKDNTK